MTPIEKIKTFYLNHLPNAKQKEYQLTAPCPFCHDRPDARAGKLVVNLNPESYFRGYFRCSRRCTPAGFHHHFARLAGIPPAKVPGFDPDLETFVPNVQYPPRHLGAEINQFKSLVGEDQYRYFSDFGVSKAILNELKIGFNGRYLVYPYFQESGFAYAAHCVMAGREEDRFWHGNEAFSKKAFRIYNVQEISRCDDGALFITDGELNLLILKQLGYPAIAVPAVADLEEIEPRRLGQIEYIFLLVSNTPEARLTARRLATKLGFKARILTWPDLLKRGQHLSHLAARMGSGIKQGVASMVRQSKSFSPFTSREKECRRFMDFLGREKGKRLLGLETGFAKLDHALDGLRGINIMGGPPKAGKSCFFMQISTQIARKGYPVIYYDFENGRQKIYLRTLVRTSNLAEKNIRRGDLSNGDAQTLKKAWAHLDTMLKYFRVVTDRKLDPEMMRRHIDFIKHETRKDDVLVVLDSLHKLPFKSMTERRTGIDSWLRQLEAIRDEQQVCFMVISELTRGKGGGYGEKPDISSFKESGDIEYSADNAMVLVPNWDPLAPGSTEQRINDLWIVASRESNPGRVAEYRLDYPYWRFQEL